MYVCIYIYILVFLGGGLVIAAEGMLQVCGGSLYIYIYVCVYIYIYIYM